MKVFGLDVEEVIALELRYNVSIELDVSFDGRAIALIVGRGDRESRHLILIEELEKSYLKVSDIIYNFLVMLAEGLDA